MTRYVLGVDGGTSKTIALLADDLGHILAASRGPGSNCTTPDIERPMSVVATVARQALEQAALPSAPPAAPPQADLGLFALAGADWPEDYPPRQAFLERSALAQQVVVKNDTLAGLRSGASRPYGVVIAAGTGVNAGAISPDGRTYLYGYYVDVGGSGSIGAAALRAVWRAEDGRGAPTLLTSLVLAQAGYPSAEALLKAALAGLLPHAIECTFCPLVFQAAVQGDAVAADIVVHIGQALAEYATAAIHRFDMRFLAFDLVLAGGVFRGQGPLLIDTITQAVHRVAPHARVVHPSREPAVGAVLLAYDALGITVTAEMLHNLDCSAPPDTFFDTRALFPTSTRISAKP